LRVKTSINEHKPFIEIIEKEEKKKIDDEDGKQYEMCTRSIDFLT
jgi:hypothetical protein